MFSPVFVVCQGRTGGTHLADCIARALEGQFLYEPLHPRLLRNVQENPECTHQVLGHTTLRRPNRGYQLYSFQELVAHHCTRECKDRSVEKWLDYLVAGATHRPVFKVCRLFGRLPLLRAWYPAAAIVHLWRDFGGQKASYQRVGFDSDYFGNGAAYGLPPGELRTTWERAKQEGQDVANASLLWQDVLDHPQLVAERLRPVLQLNAGQYAKLVVQLGDRG